MTTYTDLQERWRDARESAEVASAIRATHDMTEAVDRVVRENWRRADAAERTIGRQWKIAGPYPPVARRGAPPLPRGSRVTVESDRRQPADHSQRRPSHGYVPTSEELVLARRRLGLSQRAAAQLMGMNRAVLSGLELGTRRAAATRADVWRVYERRAKEGAA